MSTEELYREYEAVSEAVDTIINFLNEKGTWINSIQEIKDYCLSKERSSE